jgi:hypothetical protein
LYFEREKLEIHKKNLVGPFEGNRPFGTLGVDGRITLRMILKI